jgi:hypothetical protein
MPAAGTASDLIPSEFKPFHQLLALASQHGHVAVGNCPDDWISHARIAMRQLIAEINDSPGLT